MEQGPVDWKEYRWRQYEVLGETIRWGYDIMLKANTFYYAVTGGIVSYYLANRATTPRLWIVLALPWLLGVACAGILLFAGLSMRHPDKEIDKARRLFRLRAYPSAQQLRTALIASALGIFLIVCGITGLLIIERGWNVIAKELLVVLLNVGGAVLVGIALRPSKEHDSLRSWFTWGHGVPVAFNRGLFWLGLLLIAAGGIAGARR